MKIAISGHRPNKLPNKEIGYKDLNPLKEAVDYVKKINRDTIFINPATIIKG